MLPTQLRPPPKLARVRRPIRFEYLSYVHVPSILPRERVFRSSFVSRCSTIKITGEEAKRSFSFSSIGRIYFPASIERSRNVVKKKEMLHDSYRACALSEIRRHFFRERKSQSVWISLSLSLSLFIAWQHRSFPLTTNAVHRWAVCIDF